MNTLAAAAAAPADGPPGEDRAALQAQRVVRGFLGRLSAVRQANLIYEKIFDPRTGGYYYYNTRTFTTTWNVRGCTDLRVLSSSSVRICLECDLFLRDV